MDDMVDNKLLSMARSLQEHVRTARDLDLDFVAQLIGMAVMEITIKIHGISHQEIDALCRRIEERTSSEDTHAVALVSGSRSHDRRARVRRSRSG